MNYYLLDSTNKLSPIGLFSEEELMDKYNFTKEEMRSFLNTGKKLEDKFILVEEIFEGNDQGELSQMFDESLLKYFYITSKGKVFYITKKNGIKGFLSTCLNGRGQLTVRANQKTHVIKNLIATYFIKEWHPGCIVILKDGDPYNFSFDNIQIYTKSQWNRKLQNDRIKIPIGLYENNKLIKTYDSMTAASNDLFIDKKSISLIVNKKCKRQSPYDLRRLL